MSWWKTAAVGVATICGAVILLGAMLETDAEAEARLTFGCVYTDSDPWREYFDLFAMESFRVKKDDKYIKMKVCHEHIKLRTAEWASCFEKVFEEGEATLKEPYKDLLSNPEKGPELWVVYVTEFDRNEARPIDFNELVAFLVVKKVSEGSFLNLPIVSLKAGLPCGLEGMMEGFATRMSIMRNSEPFCQCNHDFETRWTRQLGWIPPFPRWNHVSPEWNRFREAFYGRPPLMLVNGVASLKIPKKEYHTIVRILRQLLFNSTKRKDSLPKEGEVLDHARVAWQLRVTRGDSFKHLVGKLIERGLLTEFLAHYDFRRRLGSSILASTALRSYQAHGLSSFYLMDFLNNCYLLVQVNRLKEIGESSYKENDCFFYYDWKAGKTPEFGKNMKIRKLVFSPNRSSADELLKLTIDELPADLKDFYLEIRKLVLSRKRSSANKLLKLTLDELPADLKDFYCSINSIAFAAIRYKRLDLLHFAVRLVLQKYLTISPRPPSSLHWFADESEEAAAQGSALTAHLLKTLCGSIFVSKGLTIEELFEAIHLQSLKLLYHDWSSKSPKDAVGLLTDCSQFYTKQ